MKPLRYGCNSLISYVMVAQIVNLPPRLSSNQRAERFLLIFFYDYVEKFYANSHVKAINLSSIHVHASVVTYTGVGTTTPGRTGKRHSSLLPLRVSGTQRA